MSRSSWCFPSWQATSARTVVWHISRPQLHDVGRRIWRRTVSSTATATDHSKQLPPIRYTALSHQHPIIARNASASEIEAARRDNKIPLVRRVWASDESELNDTTHTLESTNELQSRQSFLSDLELLSDREFGDVSKDIKPVHMPRTSSKPRSRRLKLIARETPSQSLNSALESVGCTVGIAKQRSAKVDLSTINPMNATLLDKTALRTTDHGPRQARSRLSYTSIVADYIRRVYPSMENMQTGAKGNKQLEDDLDKALLSVFDDRPYGPLAYLSRRGYSPEDVVTWAWILTSSTSLKAARRLEVVETWNRKSLGSQENRIPPFVLLFILRRENVNARALRILMSQARQLLIHPSENSKPTSTGEFHEATQLNGVQGRWERKGDRTTFIILIIRLIRHARAVWPQCLLPIAALTTSSLGVSATTGNAGTLKPHQSQQLTFVFNKLLSLLAHPCSVEAYHSVPVQQRAQFHLLREMSRFKPPLAVTREGYQAVTRIQLAHRKTLAEREWAQFKAPSWPPWKEEKLGIDFDRGNEGSRSRAMESINHMRTAGYAPTGWERLANIYAGWDVDGTPTIQKRVFLPKPSGIRTVLGNTTSESLDPPIRVDVKGTKYESDRIWAARISTTRTLREAWACFLSYQDQCSGRPHMGVYFAMAEKLVARKVDSAATADHSSEAMPGDGIEVYPEPSSPKDVTYVRSEPPTLERFLDEMLAENIKPNAKILCLILPHISSFKSGLDYLSRSMLREEHIKALAFHPVSQTDTMRQQYLSEIENDLFAAFIAFLGRFSTLDSLPEDGSRLRMAQLFPVLISSRPTTISETSPSEYNPEQLVQHSRALIHAIDLIKLQKSRYLPAWHRLLSALSMDRAKIRFSGGQVSLTKRRILAWCEIAEVLAWMKRDIIPADLRTLEIVCSALIKVIGVISQDPHGSEKGLQIAFRVKEKRPHSISATLQSLSGLVTEGMRFIKSHFDQLAVDNESSPVMLTEPSASANVVANAPLMLPNLFAVPSPFLLHSLVRLFGLVGDQKSLVRLLQWMNFFADDVRFAADERIGGMKQLRHAVIAARVFLEGHLNGPQGAFYVSDEDVGPGESNSEDTSEEWHDEKTRCASESSGSLVEEARAVVEGTEILAPWPSDEEVRLYVELGNQKL